MKTLCWWAWFACIQLASLVLGLVGIPLCAYLAWFGKWAWGAEGEWHWASKAAWLWDNDEDGICPFWFRAKRTLPMTAFIWTALRNPVNNLRYVPGVSGPGRPYWLILKTIRGKSFYFHAGWLPGRNEPVLSLGAT